MSPTPEPQDPFEEYLENVELLAALTRKRDEVVAQRGALEERGHNVNALLASIETHRTCLQDLVTQQESLMDQFLEGMAKHADAGRELFIAVVDLIKAMQRLTPEEWALVPLQNREHWRQLMAQFEPMRTEWLQQLTPEDRQRLEITE